MAIDPEVIPSSSTLGSDASNVKHNRLNITSIIIISIALIFILKTIFSTVLIGLGLWFIWKQATKKID